MEISKEKPPSQVKDTRPDLPPRNSSEIGLFPPARLPRTFSLAQFARRFSDKLPVHVKVSEGFYGTSTLETLSGQQELVILCEKRREVLRIRSKSGKTYSIPYGSSVPISLLYDRDENETKAKTGVTFKSLGNLCQDNLPKVIACSTSDGKLPVSEDEILVIKRLDVQNRKLYVHSIPSKDESDSASEKEIYLNCRTKSTFSTKPHLTALYLSDIIKYVHSPCERSSKALLDLSKLSSSDYDEVMDSDPMLSEPVVLIEWKTEASLVAVTVEKDDSLENSQFFEIPMEEKFGIEFTVLDIQNTTQQAQSYLSFFSQKKLTLWVTDTIEPSQAIQQIFNYSLRSEYEMEGIDIPQPYEEIEYNGTTKSSSASNMPVSIPVLSNPSYCDMPPELPPKPKANAQPSPRKPSQQSLNPLGPVESSPAQDFTKTREFEELIDKAVRKSLSGPLERLLSMSSSEPDSPLESKYSIFELHGGKAVSFIEPQLMPILK